MSPKRPLSCYGSSQTCTLKSYRSVTSLNKIRQVETYQLEDFILPIKSQFGAEFRRFSISLRGGKPSPSFSEFYETVQNIHRLTEEQRVSTHITYISQDGSNLPISNDDNFRKAVETLPKILRIMVQNKGESLAEEFGYGVSNDTVLRRRRKVSISAPQDFRRVSSILDADILPHELRRVRLCKFYNNKPLGFFIRDDNYSERLTPWGLIATPGIFISRLLPNGLAASTNLLSINDEILEVNGIDVSEKSLDQVTDIMIANSTNLILTVKPAVPSSFPYLTYAPPPYTIPAPPGYCSPQHQRMSQSCYSFHSNLHYYGGENHAETIRLPIPPFNATQSFSRENTWRLSEKLAKMSLRSRDSAKRNKRPFSVHCSAIPNAQTLPYANYGY